MLREGERFLDIGAGWGGLLLGGRAYGDARAGHHAVAPPARPRQPADRGTRPAGRVSMQLLDYRELPEDQPFDKIASVGMFEHVGSGAAGNPIRQDPPPAAPGWAAAAQPRHHRRRAACDQLGAGLGDFIERYIFPGGELLHASKVLEVMADQGLEALDDRNLRPHYARTLWAWSDGLGESLEAARRIAGERRARLPPCLGGSAMRASSAAGSRCTRCSPRPDGDPAGGALRGTIGLSVQPRPMYPPPATHDPQFKVQAAGDLIMMGPRAIRCCASSAKARAQRASSGQPRWARRSPHWSAPSPRRKRRARASARRRPRAARRRRAKRLAAPAPADGGDAPGARRPRGKEIVWGRLKRPGEETMRLVSNSWVDGDRIPARLLPPPTRRARRGFSGQPGPHLAWSEIPQARSPSR